MREERIKPYIVVKPEGARYLQELEETLREQHVRITNIFSIHDWETVARALYEPQLHSSDRAFNVGFETHLWLVKHLFGNQALVLVLNVPGDKEDLDGQARTAYKARNHFRSKFAESTSGTFVIAINLDRLPGETYIGAGVTGHLGILNPEASFTPLIEVNFTGRWDNHFFKYIHTPSDAKELEYEWNTLIRLGIITKENKVSRKEWELLKFLRSLVPPGRYKRVRKEM